MPDLIEVKFPLNDRHTRDVPRGLCLVSNIEGIRNLVAQT